MSAIAKIKGDYPILYQDYHSSQKSWFKRCTLKPCTGEEMTNDENKIVVLDLEIITVDQKKTFIDLTIARNLDRRHFDNQLQENYQGGS